MNVRIRGKLLGICEFLQLRTFYRILSLPLIRRVLDNIEESSLKGFIKASYIETLQQMHIYASKSS